MSDEAQPQSSIILYLAEDGRTRIECRFENETLWLTQAQIAELFQTTPQNVTLHVKAIFAEGELSEAATCKDYLQVRPEGARTVFRQPRCPPTPRCRRPQLFGNSEWLAGIAQGPIFAQCGRPSHE